jgi:molybdopterin synthase catalytic subunit
LSVGSGVHEKGTFTISDVLSNTRKKETFKKAGAIAMFIGVVRGETLDGKKAEKMTMEAYEEKANEVLAEICEDLSKHPGIVDVQIHHLLGDFDVGEDLVYVAVAGAHRKEVFDVLHEAVERYKSEAPVFKKERVIDAKGKAVEYWVSEKREA